MRSTLAGERTRKLVIGDDLVGGEHYEATSLRITHPLGRRCEPLYATRRRLKRSHDGAYAAIARNQALLFETAQRLTYRVATYAMATHQLVFARQHRAHRVTTRLQIFLQHLGERSVTWLSSIDTHRIAS